MKIIATLAIALSTVLAQAVPTTNQPPRSAIVEWDASTSPGIANYTVYCSTNPFWVGTNMVLSPILVQQWPEPSTVTNQNTGPILAVGRTYYFVVTATDTNGFESAYSQQVSLFITPRVMPQPPTVHIPILLSGSSTPVGPWDPVDLLAEYLITPDCDYAFYRAVVDIHR